MPLDMPSRGESGDRLPILHIEAPYVLRRKYSLRPICRQAVDHNGDVDVVEAPLVTAVQCK